MPFCRYIQEYVISTPLNVCTYFKLICKTSRIKSGVLDPHTSGQINVWLMYYSVAGVKIRSVAPAYTNYGKEEGRRSVLATFNETSKGEY